MRGAKWIAGRLVVPRLAAFVSALSIGMCCVLSGEPRAAPDPRLKLWERAQECVAEAKSKAIKFPCIQVSQHGQYALVHDTAAGKTGVFMLLATVRVTGIEDPLVLQTPVHAFFEFGWRELTALIKRNPWNLAMAVNNNSVRTQDQLHVHLGCVRDDIRTTLDHANLSNQWSDIKLHGHQFIAMRVDSLSHSPFEILQAHLVSKGEQIGDYSLAVVGWDHGKFVLLATKSAAELVMDESASCHT